MERIHAFVVIPAGLSLFCGSQKIGKSWLMLKLCLCVSQGTPFWEIPTTQGDVLYLCLEDTFYRIQDRLFKLTDGASERLHFAVASCKLTDGTTGLTGSADATFVLEKEHRASDTATLYAIGRDIEYQEFTLCFRDCNWELVERKGQEQLAAAVVPPVLFRVAEFMQDRQEWSGTATELLKQLGETVTAVNLSSNEAAKIPLQIGGINAMPYAILRFQKRKAGSVAACERHNERKQEAYKSNPDIDMERSKDNYHLVKPPRYTYKKEINRRISEAGCKVRRDSVMMVETLITASPEFMNSLPKAEQKVSFFGEL